MLATVKEVHAKIVASALESENETIRIPEMEVGEHVRQGDIYIVKVELTHPHGPELKTKQLVKGITQGSRHIAEGPVRLFAGEPHSSEFMRVVPSADQRQRVVACGPVVLADDRWFIGHPEHAEQALPPGCYQVVHQFDFREQAAVRD